MTIFRHVLVASGRVLILCGHSCSINTILLLLTDLARAKHPQSQRLHQLRLRSNQTLASVKGIKLRRWHAKLETHVFTAVMAILFYQFVQSYSGDACLRRRISCTQ